METFLNPDAVIQLTGRRRKSKQIEALQQMGLPFWVNAIGEPVVALAAIEGRKEAPREKVWVMPRRGDGQKKYA